MRVRKYKKPREVRRLFLVICEGETEEAYVNLLKRHYRLPIAIKTKILGNTVTQRLVNQYINEFGATPEDCRIFFIYDADVAPVKEKIQKLTGMPILSNPCIEVWFTLHHRELSKCITSGTAVAELHKSHPIWKEYSKGAFSVDQEKSLIENKHVAAMRAQKLLWPENPSSNMNHFIEALEAEKSLR